MAYAVRAGGSYPGGATPVLLNPYARASAKQTIRLTVTTIPATATTAYRQAGGVGRFNPPYVESKTPGVTKTRWSLAGEGVSQYDDKRQYPARERS